MPRANNHRPHNHELSQELHLHMIDVCQELGSISGSNALYTAGLNRKIQDTGKAIEDLTVGELLKIHHDHHTWYMKTYL